MEVGAGGGAAHAVGDESKVDDGDLMNLATLCVAGHPTACLPILVVEQSESMDKCLQGLIARIPGVHALLVSNQYGLLLIKSVSPVVVDPMPTTGVDVFSTVFAMAAEQGEKLMFGPAKTCISCFDGVTLVHIAHYPLVITLLATSTVNLGMILHVVPQLKQALAPVQVKAEAELG